MSDNLYIEIPAEILQSMKLPPDEIKENLLKELALALYQRKILSFGKARQLGNMTKWEFQEELNKRGITRHYTEKELKEDLEFAKRGGSL